MQWSGSMRRLYKGPTIYGASGNSVGHLWVEIEATAVEVDRRLEVVAIAETVGHLLEGLDLAGDALAHGVGDAMPEVSQHVGQMPLDHPRHLEDRLQPGARRPAVPEAPLPLGRDP